MKIAKKMALTCLIATASMNVGAADDYWNGTGSWWKESNLTLVQLVQASFAIVGFSTVVETNSLAPLKVNSNLLQQQGRTFQCVEKSPLRGGIELLNQKCYELKRMDPRQ